MRSAIIAGLATIAMDTALTTSIFKSLAVLPFLALVHGPAVANDFLRSLSGSWNGAGWARRDPGAPSERLRCRVINRYLAGTSSVEMMGRCAAPGKNRRFRVTLKYEAGVYVGRIGSDASGGSAEVRGRKSNDALYLKYVAKVRETGETLSGRLVLRKTGSGFSIVTTGTIVETGKSATLGSIRFVRKR